MLGDSTRQITFLTVTNLWDLVPDDHILKQVDAILDLSWLRGEVGNLYHPTLGRTAIAPEIALRLMLAGYFLEEVKDRALMRRAQTDLAIRAFARLDLAQELPDHSTLTRIRQRWGTVLFLHIFVRSVKDCQAAGLVAGRLLHMDPTLVRANVSWASMEEVQADAVTQATRMLEENPDDEDDVPPAKKKVKKRSRTDPDATLATSQKNRPMEPCYKVRHVVDSKAGVIVDVAVTTGEECAGPHLPETVQRVTATLGMAPSQITADKESASAANYAFCEEQGIEAVIPHHQVPGRKRSRGKGARRAKAQAKRRARPQRIPARRFKYDPQQRLVRCPCQNWLYPSHRDDRGWLYRGDPRVCGACHCRKRCFAPTARARVIRIVDGYEASLRARREKERGWGEEKRAAYRSHRQRVEGVQGEAKEQHGLRRAVRFGTDNMLIQAALTAIVINLKRLARARAARKLTSSLQNSALVQTLACILSRSIRKFVDRFRSAYMMPATHAA